MELVGLVLTLRRAVLDPALAPGLGLAALALPVLAPLALALPLERALFFISGGKLQPAVLVVGALRFWSWRRVASVPELVATPQRRAPIRLHAGSRRASAGTNPPLPSRSAAAPSPNPLPPRRSPLSSLAMASNSSTTNTSASASTSRSTSPSDRRSSASSGGNGAAAEPEPSEVPSATTTYHVRDYQNPDAGAADRPLTKTAAKGKDDSKGKKGGSTSVCFHCGKSGAKLRSCGQCHRAYYCDRECQLKDWERHKPACVAAVAAEAKQATRAREATAAAGRRTRSA